MFAEGRKNANIFRETCSSKIREGFLKFWLSSEVLSKFSKPLRIKMKKTKKNKTNLKRADAYHGLMHTLMNN